MSDRAAVCLLADAAPAKEGDVVAGFSGVAYSGGVVPNHGWSGDMAIDLASMSLPRAEVPILLNHDPAHIVGRAVVENDGSALRITRGRFSGVTQAGKEVAALMGEGHPWSLSVGVNATRHEADRKTPTKLNGRDMPIDTVLRNARLLEVSFVPSGADPSAYAARLSAMLAQSEPPKGPTMDAAAAQQRITELEAQVATLKTERDTARTDLAAVQLSARNAEIVALFGEKHTLTDPQLAAYRAMPADQFAVVRETLGAAAKLDPALTRQEADSGRDHQGGTVTRFDSSRMAPELNGVPIDERGAQVDAKARAYMAAHNSNDYLAAVRAVEQGA